MPFASTQNLYNVATAAADIGLNRYSVGPGVSHYQDDDREYHLTMQHQRHRMKSPKEYIKSNVNLSRTKFATTVYSPEIALPFDLRYSLTIYRNPSVFSNQEVVNMGEQLGVWISTSNEAAILNLATEQT